MGHGIDALHRLTVTFQLHGSYCQNVFWFRSKPTTTAANLQDESDKIVNDWKLQIWPYYKPCCSPDLQLVTLLNVCVEPTGIAQTIASYTVEFGSFTGESLPSHCAAVIGLYSRYPGRRTHGRCYIPGIPEAAHQNSVMSLTQMTNLSTLAGRFLTYFGDNGTSPQVWGGVFSRKNGAVRLPGPPPFIHYSPLAHLPWYRVVVNSTVFTNRHRLRGRGI